MSDPKIFTEVGRKRAPVQQNELEELTGKAAKVADDKALRSYDLKGNPEQLYEWSRFEELFRQHYRAGKLDELLRAIRQLLAVAPSSDKRTRLINEAHYIARALIQEIVERELPDWEVLRQHSHQLTLKEPETGFYVVVEPAVSHFLNSASQPAVYVVNVSDHETLFSARHFTGRHYVWTMDELIKELKIFDTPLSEVGVKREAWCRQIKSNRRLDELKRLAVRGQISKEEAQELYALTVRYSSPLEGDLEKKVFEKAWPKKEFKGLLDRIQLSGILRMYQWFRRQYPRDEDGYSLDTFVPPEQSWWNTGPYAPVLRLYEFLREAVESYRDYGYVPAKLTVPLLSQWREFEAKLPHWKKELHKLEKAEMEPWQLKEWERHQKWLSKNPDAANKLLQYRETVQEAEEKEELSGERFSLTSPEGGHLTLWSLGRVIENMIQALNGGERFSESYRDNWRLLPGVMEKVEEFLRP